MSASPLIRRCGFPILALLMATLGPRCDGRPVPVAGGAPPDSRRGSKKETTGYIVNVLVLTARGKEKDPGIADGLGVLAGLCLALSEDPKQADQPSHPSSAKPLILSVEAGRKGKAVTEPPVKEAKDLWPLLVDYSECALDQLRVTAKWPNITRSIRFCFADEHLFQVSQLDREACQIIFGPVHSGEAGWLPQMRGRPDIPVLSPAATSTKLRKDAPPTFYRFITPDATIVQRLATELVEHVHARHIAVLYENTGYGRGLCDDFRDALPADQFLALPYDRGTIDSGRLQDELKELRILRVDALGLFGSLEDKKAILELRQHVELPNHPPASLVFTTDADLGWEGFPCDGNVMMASLLDPHERDAATLSARAYALMSTRPRANVQPNVYMLQSRRATHFLLNVVKRMQPTGPSAVKLFSEHRSDQLANGRADPRVEFDQYGDLDGDLADPRLLVLKHGELTAFSQRPIRSLWDLFSHPIGLYLILYVFILVGVVVGRYAGAWEESEQESESQSVRSNAALRKGQAADGFPPLFYERWLTWGYEWPDWLPYHTIAAAVFMLYSIFVIWNQKQSFSFFPNEFSAIPSVFLQCHLAAVCLWYVASMRVELWLLYRHLPACNLPELVKPLSEAARRVFTVSYRRRLGLLLIVAILLIWDVHGWDVRFGLPIVGEPGRRGYILITVFTVYAYLFALWIVWKANQLARHLAEAYPLGDNLWLTYHDFRMLVAPFVSMTYTAALVFAGIVISRSRFFDHWGWTVPHYLFFGVIAGLLLWLLFNSHRQWHLRLCQAKRRILDLQHPAHAPDGAQRAALEQVQAVPTWPWNPTLSLRVLSVLAAPLVVALLQNNKWALSLWQAAGQLLGSK
jgi:ABC-type branched-subunit amino acid transport system substrate-binding protein